MKNLPIKMTANARADLDALWNSVAQHNIDSAEKLMERLNYRIQSLAQFPETGIPRPEIYEKLRLLVEGDYVVLYLARDEMVIILRVVHGARDLIRLNLL